MNKYSFEINIEAHSQQEAEEKLKAASTLMEKLKAKEITTLADVVKNNPVKTAIAIKFYNHSRGYPSRASLDARQDFFNFRFF